MAPEHLTTTYVVNYGILCYIVSAVNKHGAQSGEQDSVWYLLTGRAVDKS